LFVTRVLATLSIPCWSAGEGASISINRLHLTASLQRPVRRSRSCSIPSADGKDSEEILGATAHLNPKGRGDKSMPIKPRTAEGAYVVARQAPRDMAKAGLLEVQCSSVNGGPLVIASDRQVDSSDRHADGLCDLCESSTAQ